jgi:PPK2 family polyphosphate:nucleotide phosphotransferase
MRLAPAGRPRRAPAPLTPHPEPAPARSTPASGDRPVKQPRLKTDRFRLRPGKRVNLANHDTADTAPFRERADAEGLLEKDLEELATLQDRLYAEDRWGLLLIFQALDGAGKDSIVKHVLRGLNPHGTHAVSFKAPSTEELDHDFMWRCMKEMPQRGRIGIFNRSYYEEVLVVRVHPGVLAAQHLPTSLVTKRIWQDRYEDINAMERYLTRNGIAIRKFYLNVSEDEQKKRFLERITDPSKNWKFSMEDIEKRKLWGDYRDAYEEMLAATSTEWAPWYVVPADRKWFTRLAVASIVREALETINPQYPVLSKKQQSELKTAQRMLESEDS